MTVAMAVVASITVIYVRATRKPMVMTVFMLMPMIPQKALLYITTFSIMNSKLSILFLLTLIAILASMCLLVLVDQIIAFMTMLTNPC